MLGFSWSLHSKRLKKENSFTKGQPSVDVMLRACKVLLRHKRSVVYQTMSRKLIQATLREADSTSIQGSTIIQHILGFQQSIALLTQGFHQGTTQGFHQGTAKQSMYRHSTCEGPKENPHIPVYILPHIQPFILSLAATGPMSSACLLFSCTA